MSEPLKKLVTAKVMDLGTNGDAKLAITTDLSLSTIRNAKLRGHVSKQSGYALALACGASKEEALQISEECSSLAKETA